MSAEDWNALPPWVRRSVRLSGFRLRSPIQVVSRFREESDRNAKLSQQVAQLSHDNQRLRLESESVKQFWQQKLRENDDAHKTALEKYKEQVHQWKEQKEKEFNEVLEGKEQKLKKNKELIASAVAEIKQWKENQDSAIQRVIQQKNKEMEEKEQQLREALQRLRLLEQQAGAASARGSAVGGGVGSPTGSESGSLSGSAESLPESPASTVGGVRAGEAEREAASRLGSVYDIESMLAHLEARKQALFYEIKRGEEARQELSVLEGEIIQKRKDLVDTLKDVKAAQILKNKRKEQAEQVEQYVSLVQDAERRRQLLHVIERREIATSLLCRKESLRGALVGPALIPGKPPAMQTLGEMAAAHSVSAYPVRARDAQGEHHEGDPICDRYHLQTFEGGCIVALADGCGWGESARLAAERACDTFVGYVSNFLSDVTNTRQAAKLLLRAYRAAHQAILKGCTPETYFTVGTTTMLAGVVCPLSHPRKDASHAFLFVSLGDCKAYKFSASTHRFQDLSEIKRATATDPRDPGGRLGPQLPGGAPDLRNLSVYLCTLEEGDILLLVSDGVHDNLDPQHLGKAPHDIGLQTESDSWEHVEDHTVAQKKKAEWSSALLNSLVLEDTPLGPAASPAPALAGSPRTRTAVTPAIITTRLVQHALATTRNSRAFMEQHPGKRVPYDMSQYPGKMDHATCVCYQLRAQHEKRARGLTNTH